MERAELLSGPQESRDFAKQTVRGLPGSGGHPEWDAVLSAGRNVKQKKELAHLSLTVFVTPIRVILGSRDRCPHSPTKLHEEREEKERKKRRKREERGERRERKERKKEKKRRKKKLAA